MGIVAGYSGNVRILLAVGDMRWLADYPASAVSRLRVFVYELGAL